MDTTWIDRLNSDRAAGRKGWVALIDPDHATTENELAWLKGAKPHSIFLGGSLVSSGNMTATAESIREQTDRPIILFPGSPTQLTGAADGLLFLSVISGRNPEALIGAHVQAAPQVRALGLPTIPCGYLLIDGGRPTAASYMSGTTPIPADQPEIAATTALAGAYLGLRCIYLDAGSGAKQAISAELITAVRAATDLPLIVGGGIRSVDGALDAWSAGADLVVIGNALQQSPALSSQLSAKLAPAH
jgi:phosphoglycerol geranylgeranyltransferase